jgi:nitric oxide reductase activation protein
LGAAVALAAPAIADESNQKTIFTFSESVELPGKTLPAGTYTFRLADSPSSRNIVQVFNKEETELITTLLAISAERRDPAEDAIVMFAERAQNVPAAVQYWYYPGRTIGHEFVYPRMQAVRIAKATNKPVLATDTASNDNDSMRQGHVTRVSPQGEDTEVAQSASRAIDSGRPADDVNTSSRSSGVQSGMSIDESSSRTAAGARTAQSTSQSANTGNRPARLPQTASGEAMILLLAMSSALGLGTVGAFRRW